MSDTANNKECRRRGWYCVLRGNGTGYRPVPRTFPNATEDLNRLAYYQQTGIDAYYHDVDLNPWLLDRRERALWLG
jgi:hypothetical protein